MTEPRFRKLLVTIRAALLMAAKAIEVYLGNDSDTVRIGDNDDIALSS